MEPQAAQLARRYEQARSLYGKVTVALHEERDHRGHGEERRDVGEVVLDGEARDVLQGAPMAADSTDIL